MGYFILRLVQQINTWMLIPSIIYLLYINNIIYYLATVLSVLLISKVGASIGLHRYFSHKSFKTSAWKENLMALMGTLSSTGSTLEYVTVHRYHHTNSDNGKDLHSPHEIGYWRSFWHWYSVDVSSVTNSLYIRDLLKKPFLIFLHNYYFIIIISYVTILGLIDINLIIFCYMIPAGFSWWTSGLGSASSHYLSNGYRNFDTKDNSVNSLLFNWLTLGEGLHNNHHAKPNEYNNAFTRKKGEWDLSALIVELFLNEKSSERK